VFLARHDLQCDLRVAGIGQCRDALLQLLLGRREGRAPDQFGGDKPPLLRLHEHQMAAVVFEIMGALRREFAGQLDIARHALGDRGRHRRHHRQPRQCRVGRAMQQHRGTRPGLCDGARRVGGLALFQYRAAGQDHGIERLRRAPGGPPPLPHVGHRGDPAIDIAGRGDPAGAELRGQAARPRTRGCDVKRDRVTRVDQSELRVQQPHQSLFVFDFGLDRLPP
jgi:hypothetical protein